jgi:hypothetical protein
MEKIRIRIRDKNPESATLGRIFFFKSSIYFHSFIVYRTSVHLHTISPHGSESILDLDPAFFYANIHIYIFSGKLGKLAIEKHSDQKIFTFQLLYI